MVEPRTQASPNSSVSFIPVMASPMPRKASGRNALPSSFGFSLLPTPRMASRQSSASTSSGPPSPVINQRSVSIGSSPSPQPSANTGIPKFRSLRNMLPFGPKTPNAPSNATSSPAKPVTLTHRRSSSSNALSEAGRREGTARKPIRTIERFDLYSQYSIARLRRHPCFAIGLRSPYQSFD